MRRGIDALVSRGAQVSTSQVLCNVLTDGTASVTRTDSPARIVRDINACGHTDLVSALAHRVGGTVDLAPEGLVDGVRHLFLLTHGVDGTRQLAIFEVVSGFKGRCIYAGSLRGALALRF